MKTINCMWIGAAALMVSAGTADAGLISVDFTSVSQGLSGNTGMSYVPVDTLGNLSPMTLTASARLNTAQAFDPIASSTTGGIITIGFSGVGVRSTVGSGGSAGISGGGANQNEQVIITFDNPTVRDQLVVTLSAYDPGTGLLNKDDSAIFVHLTSGSWLTFNEFDIVDTTIGYGILDLSTLLGANDLVDQIIVRETKGHLLLGGITAMATVPGPGALALLGVAGLRRRRRRQG